MVGKGRIKGPMEAFGWRGENRVGEFDYKMYYERYDEHLFFQIETKEWLADSEFGNYLAGYTIFHNYGYDELAKCLAAGHFFGAVEWGQSKIGVRDRDILWPADDFGSQYWIFRGAREANRQKYTGAKAKANDILLGYAVWDRNIMRKLDYFQYGQY